MRICSNMQEVCENLRRAIEHGRTDIVRSILDACEYLLLTPRDAFLPFSSAPFCICTRGITYCHIPILLRRVLFFPALFSGAVTEALFPRHTHTHAYLYLYIICTLRASWFYNLKGISKTLFFVFPVRTVRVGINRCPTFFTLHITIIHKYQRGCIL